MTKQKEIENQKPKKLKPDTKKEYRGGTAAPMYTEELAKKICRTIATTTDSYPVMQKKNPDFPDRCNFRLWRIKNEWLRAEYDQAKKDQAALYIEELEELARDDSKDFYEGPKGKTHNPTRVARDKLIVDTRKWIASKALPKIYGERPQDTQEKSQEIQELTEMINKLVTKYEREY